MHMVDCEFPTTIGIFYINSLRQGKVWLLCVVSLGPFRFREAWLAFLNEGLAPMRQRANIHIKISSYNPWHAVSKLLNATGDSRVAHLQYTIHFPLPSCGFRWHVSIEASETLRSLRVFENQMLYFDILVASNPPEDFTLFQLPARAVKERHIWWICLYTYVCQSKIFKHLFEELASAVDHASSRL